MRWGIHGWLMLAALWAGHAGAGEAGGAVDPWMDVANCAQGQALLQRQAPADPQYRAFVQELCELEAAQPRHDPETLDAIEQWQRDHLAAIGRQVRMWLVSRDPHEQVAAALLLPMLHMQQQGQTPPTEPQWSNRQVGAAFAAARDLAPDDRLVAWLEVVACPGWGVASDSGCAPESALARLPRLDPGNAAVWLQGLGSTAPESIEAEQLLAKAAASSHYQIPFAAAGRLLTAVLARVDAPPLSPQVAVAMGLDFGLGRPTTRRDLDGHLAMAVISAQTLPAYVALSRACSGDGDAVTAQRRALCIAIHTLIVEEPTALSQRVALVRLVLLSAEQPEGTGWRERLREHHWLWQNAAALMQRAVPEGYLDTVWRDGELAAVKGLLQAAGMPLTPPAGWLPDNERLRSLVATGREPGEP